MKIAVHSDWLAGAVCSNAFWQCYASLP